MGRSVNCGFCHHGFCPPWPCDFEWCMHVSFKWHNRDIIDNRDYMDTIIASMETPRRSLVPCPTEQFLLYFFFCIFFWYHNRDVGKSTIAQPYKLKRSPKFPSIWYTETLTLSGSGRDGPGTDTSTFIQYCAAST